MEWSGAFVSRIGNSISPSYVLVSMSTELNDEVNCWVVYEWVKMLLNLSGIKTVRVMSHWTVLFGLK